MQSVKEILPIVLDDKLVAHIKNNFKFILIDKDSITVQTAIELLDREIYSQLEYLIANNVDLSDTTVDNVQKAKNLFQNIILLNNLDYADYLNVRIRGLEKWLKIDRKLGQGAEGNVYKANIVFRDLISPDFVLKKTRGSHTSQELLVEFINYYIIGKIINLTPNFVSTVGLVVCNSDKNKVEAENSQNLCSCVGTIGCVNKNYMISIPYKGDTLEKYIETNPELVQRNFNIILKQIAYSLKIAQEKFKFTHGDLNARNISCTIYPEEKTLIYKFFNKTQIQIKSNVKVNIFDFGASKFSDITELELIDKKLFNYYNLNFVQTNEIGEIIKRYQITSDSSEKLDLEKKLYEKSNYVGIGLSYDDAKDFGMFNFITKDGIEQAFNEKIAEYVKNEETFFDETADYKNLINNIYRIPLVGEFKNTVEQHKQAIESITKIDGIIKLLEPEFSTKIEHIDDLLSLNKPINTQLKLALDAIKLQNITPIFDPVNQIDIDGYNPIKLYGLEPNFNFLMVTKSFDFYNSYADIKSGNCNDGQKTKTIYWGNPGYSKFFNLVNPISWSDIKPSELPHPTEVNTFTSFTYAFVIDKYTNAISVRYGLLDNLTELGANHVIIGYNDKIIVSGELGIKKLDSGFVYYVNINSSKMSSINSKINSNNNKENNQDTDNFYYILMINIALKLFKAIEQDNSDAIQIPPGFNIKYGTQYGERHAQGMKIVEYYNTNKCPSEETISKYNEFGQTHKIKNACIGFKEGNHIQNIKMENNILKCTWDNSDLSSYYKKYMKYKQKYIKLKKQIKL